MSYHRPGERSAFAHLVNDPSLRLMTPKQAERDSEWLKEKRARETDRAAAPPSPAGITLSAEALGALVTALKAPAATAAPPRNAGPPQPIPLRCTADQIVAAAAKARGGAVPFVMPEQPAISMNPDDFAAQVSAAVAKCRW